MSRRYFGRIVCRIVSTVVRRGLSPPSIALAAPLSPLPAGSTPRSNPRTRVLSRTALSLNLPGHRTPGLCLILLSTSTWPSELRRPAALCAHSQGGTDCSVGPLPPRVLLCRLAAHPWRARARNGFCRAAARRHCAPAQRFKARVDPQCVLHALCVCLAGPRRHGPCVATGNLALAGLHRSTQTSAWHLVRVGTRAPGMAVASLRAGARSQLLCAHGCCGYKCRAQSNAPASLFRRILAPNAPSATSHTTTLQPQQRCC